MEKRILKEMNLHDGTRLVVYDVLGDETVPAADASRNVYKLDADGAVVWQIEVEAGTSARTPFTGVSRQGDRILLYRWDGIEYVVDPATGKAIPHAFIR